MIEIEFENRGQGFQRWTVDQAGTVVDCQPSQGAVWCGVTVLGEPVPGQKLTVTSKAGGSLRVVYAVRGVRVLPS